MDSELTSVTAVISHMDRSQRQVLERVIGQNTHTSFTSLLCYFLTPWWSESETHFLFLTEVNSQAFESILKQFTMHRYISVTH